MLAIAIPLISTSYISHILGPDGIGKYSFYNSICSYFVLVAIMGTATFGQREISFFQDNKWKRSIVFWENFIIRCATTIIAMTVWKIYIIMQPEHNRNMLEVLSINILGVVVDISWFFQGMEEFGKTVGRSAIFKMLNVILIFMFVKNKNDLITYIFLIVVLQVLSNLSLWLYLPQFICKIAIKDLHPFRNIRAVFQLFIPSIAIQIYTVLDKTMIGLFSESSYENGYYEQAVNISKMVLSLVAAMVTVSAPRMGYYYEKRDETSLKSYLCKSYRFVWFLSVPFCLGLFTIADNVIPWFYGQNYYNMIPVLKMSSFLIFSIGMNSVTGAQYMIPTKRHKSYTFSVLAGAACNFILNLIMIPRYYALGAATASVVAETMIMLVQFYIIKKDVDIKRIFSFSKNYLIAGGIMAVVVLFEDRYLEAKWFNTVLLVFSGGIVYFGILLLLKDSFIIGSINKVVRRSKDVEEK